VSTGPREGAIVIIDVKNLLRLLLKQIHGALTHFGILSDDLVRKIRRILTTKPSELKQVCLNLKTRGFDLKEKERSLELWVNSKLRTHFI
jgi:hypothetical protein